MHICSAHSFNQSWEALRLGRRKLPPGPLVSQQVAAAAAAIVFMEKSEVVSSSLSFDVALFYGCMTRIGQFEVPRG